MSQKRRRESNASAATQTELQYTVETESQLVPEPKTTESQLVNRDLVVEAVRFINEKANETMYKGSEEIGAYLLEHFFDNDIQFATSRNPYKSASFAALCKRDELAVHPATLSVMVRVAAQEIFFKEKGFDTSRLSYTHKAELVKLPNSDEKVALAQRALDGSYTTRLLSEAVKKVKDEAGSKTKILSSVIENCLDNPLRLFENPTRSDFVSNAANLKKMKAETRKKLHATALEMVEKTKEWTKKYQALAKQLEKIG